MQGENALACAGRPEQQRARPCLDPSAEQFVESRNAGPHALAGELPTMLGRHQAGKDVGAAGANNEIVIAATEPLATIFHDAKAAALRAILGRHFLEPQNAMGDTVDRLVRRLRREVVQKEHGYALAGEGMLQGEDLPSIAQRTLGKQADLRQGIEDDPRRLDALDGLENQPGRLSELQIRRIKEALLLVAIEQTLGRHHFKNVDAVEAPAVRRRGGL